MTCNYSTPFPIAESTEYYLYDGIELTLNTHYDLIAAVNLQSVQITRLPTYSRTAVFQGFFGAGTPSCHSVWLNRCTNTFDVFGLSLI